MLPSDKPGIALVLDRRVEVNVLREGLSGPEMIPELQPSADALYERLRRETTSVVKHTFTHSKFVSEVARHPRFDIPVSELDVTRSACENVIATKGTRRMDFAPYRYKRTARRLLAYISSVEQ